MFAFFDADHSGLIDLHEFRALLNNIFPTHCDANEHALAREFAAADADGSDSISFAEFCACAPSPHLTRVPRSAHVRPLRAAASVHSAGPRTSARRLVVCAR
jgi:hypothetical protein